MRFVKLLLTLSIFAFLASCSTDIYIEDEVQVQTITLNEVLSDYELWYVDIDATRGNGSLPFVEKAFTLSFNNGQLWANNNLAGIGNQGDGYGIPVGYYDIFDYDLDVSHDIDGFYSFEINPLSNNKIELYHHLTQTSYILKGYQRHTFDYDRLFYDNIHYFLQEYAAWEKVYTSQAGIVNEFDAENFLEFLPIGSQGNFKSSQDQNGTAIANIYWDYSGVYDVDNVSDNPYLKYLYLDYDYFTNEFFELTIVNDNMIELYHPASQTLYRFMGRGYIQYKTAEEGKKRIPSQAIQENIDQLKVYKS